MASSRVTRQLSASGNRATSPLSSARNARAVTVTPSQRHRHSKIRCAGTHGPARETAHPFQLSRKESCTLISRAVEHCANLGSSPATHGAYVQSPKQHPKHVEDVQDATDVLDVRGVRSKMDVQNAMDARRFQPTAIAVAQQP